MEAHLKLLPSTGCQETAHARAAQREAPVSVEYVQPVGTAAGSGSLQAKIHDVQADPLSALGSRQDARTVGRVRVGLRVERAAEIATQRHMMMMTMTLGV